MTGNSREYKATATLVRDAVTKLTGQIGGYFHREQKPVNEIILVPLVIIARIVRTYDAIQLLLENGHAAEAAVLVLTQFELRLDLAYTAHDVRHATEWCDHDNIGWSAAQNMKKKINSLFSDPSSRVRLSEIFKYLSGIKHGNPIYSALGYPARGNGGRLEISTGEISDAFAEEFSGQIASYSTYQLAWSAQVLNVYTGQYAVVDAETRQEILDCCIRLESVEEEFRNYLTKLVTQNQGPFGLKSWKRKKDQ